MEDRIELLVEDQTRRGGVSIAVVVSAILHALILIYFIYSYHPVSKDDVAPPIAHYVELIRQNPQDRQFTEAPGPKLDRAPQTAPFSDANRAASAPHPTGTVPTNRPGDGGSYTPPMPRPSRGNANAANQPQQQQQANAAANPQPAPSTTASALSNLTYRQPTSQASAAPQSPVNWHTALKPAQVASLGGSQQGFDINGGGGEKGFVKEGPLSFETQWYDWGEYAEGMVRRIRVNWYANMPPIIQTGLKGVLTIRFTIHRDGQLTDITILSGSGVPPYDFAAKKAIELSSPLSPLPKDFPNETERVTAMFYYNMEPPTR